MTLIPEPDIDYEELERTKVGESFYSKTGFFKKVKWVLKLKEGFIVFDNYDSAMLGELILKSQNHAKAIHIENFTKEEKEHLDFCREKLKKLASQEVNSK